MHGDVFRPPAAPAALAVYVGTGVQIFGMTLITMVFAVLGFLSPANRGGLMTAMLLLFVFMGIFAGYSSARLYKSFKVILNVFCFRDFFTVLTTIHTPGRGVEEDDAEDIFDVPCRGVRNFFLS